jgi:hypothetical protein
LVATKKLMSRKRLHAPRAAAAAVLLLLLLLLLRAPDWRRMRPFTSGRSRANGDQSAAFDVRVKPDPFG